MFMLISYLMIFQFHCWRCGEVFCTRCISTNTGLPGHHSRRAVPVCKPCFKMLRHSPSIDFPPSWSCVKEGFLFLQEFCSVSWTVKNEKENFADVMRKKNCDVVNTRSVWKFPVNKHWQTNLSHAAFVRVIHKTEHEVSVKVSTLGIPGAGAFFFVMCFTQITACKDCHVPLGIIMLEVTYG